MMDNQAGSSDAMHNNSRLLSVVYDPRDGHATIDWAYEFNGNSAAFGDHDRLPTGNALGCMWPGTVYLDEGAGPTYDEIALEVTRHGAEAWTLQVFSQGAGLAACENADDDGAADKCVRGDGAYPGWFMYSIERFYAAPLVYRVDCDAATLRFSAVNNFKQNNMYIGAYAVWDAAKSVVASGAVPFPAHWRETNVTVGGLSSGAFTLEVRNQWDDVTSVDFTC